MPWGEFDHYERGYNRGDVINLFRFIDWVMVLPKGLTESFWTELRVYEEERRMPYVTSVERLGFERGELEGRRIGREEGREEGRLEANRTLLKLQLTQRLGNLRDVCGRAIASLPSKPLEELAIGFAKLRRIALFDFESLSDLEGWLRATKVRLLVEGLTERFGVLEEGVGLDLGRLALDSLVGLVVEEVEGIEALEVWMEEQLDGRSR